MSNECVRGGAARWLVALFPRRGQFMGTMREDQVLVNSILALYDVVVDADFL